MTNIFYWIVEESAKAWYASIVGNQTCADLELLQCPKCFQSEALSPSPKDFHELAPRWDFC